MDLGYHLRRKQSEAGRGAPKRVVIVGVVTGAREKWELDDHLNELSSLVEAVGAVTVSRVCQSRPKYDPSTLIGSGKVEELGALAATHQADLVVFDDPLSPAQQRNLTDRLGVWVIDRTQLILDIFAQNASSGEGRLQVELAQLDYLMPRLVGMWEHLERQRGGIGLRGPGETQLEVDRRRVRSRIDTLKRQLVRVKRSRDIQSIRRRRTYLPRVSLVGYTNSGKSSLFQRLTGEGVAISYQPFSTLDPRVRNVQLPGNHACFMTDTVGFIRKIPHQLVQAFHATLRDISDSDLLLHVQDITHPMIEERRETVDQVLRDIGAANIPRLMVFNKADQLEAETCELLANRIAEEGAVLISAKTGFGIDGFRHCLAERVLPMMAERRDVRSVG